MKTYRVEMEVTYTQYINVEASSMGDAEELALDLFDVDAAAETSRMVRWATDLDTPSWLDQPLPALEK